MSVTRRTFADAEVTTMPGRSFYMLIAPWDSPATHLSAGLSIYPAGSAPEGHVHVAEEETIFCVAGKGRIVTKEAAYELEPGVLVHVPQNTYHATESDGPGELKLYCVFTPPVRPGTYEKN
ncbi:MAG: cupin domain-containing protein [Propionibacteriaceae bacterium]|jgi:quercetin dioxygenase-like cupin family protein|nr:cupin domain-containing protein [Propionibacteriaceae bacterium]